MMHYRENFMKQCVLLEYVLDLPLKVEEVIKIEENNGVKRCYSNGDMDKVVFWTLCVVKSPQMDYNR